MTDAAEPTRFSLMPTLLGSGLALISFLHAYPYASAYLESFIHVDDYKVREGNLSKLASAPLAAAQAAPLSVNDWPQYRGPANNGVSGASGLATRWPPDGPPLVWKRVGGPGFSSLAVVGDRVYTMWQDGDHEAVVCLAAESGQEIWRQRYLGHFTEPFSGLGPRATPLIHEGKVYALGSQGQFLCLEFADGKVRWKTDLTQVFGAPVPEYGYSMSPLLEGDRLIVMPGGPQGHSIAALNRNDGAVAWKIGDDRAGYSTPTLATLGGKRQLVCATGENLYGIQPQDGQMLWRHSWPSYRDCNVATPIVVGDYVFMSTGYNKGCVLLEVSNGPDGRQQTTTVYEHNRMRNHFSTCVLYQEHLYGFDDHFLVCMALRTGKVLWKQRGFNRGTVLLVDGKLLILGEQGKLALAEASPDAYKQLAAHNLTDTRCWSIPAVANGKLFVRDEATIWCLDLRAGKP